MLGAGLYVVSASYLLSNPLTASTFGSKGHFDFGGLHLWKDGVKMNTFKESLD